MITKHIQVSNLWIRLVSKFFSIKNTEVIIVGNQKSGTTAIAKLLAIATNKSCLSDTPLLWEPNFSDLKKGVLSLKKIILVHQYYFSKSIIKEPSLTFLFDQLVAIYPSKVKYIFIARDPRENIRSILNHLKISGNLSTKDFNKIRLSPNQKTYFDASLFGYKQQHYIAKLAERWNIATNLYLNNTKRFYLVKYELFCKNKTDYINQLSRRLNMDIKNDVTKFVNYPFQPSGEPNLNYLDFFGAENLEQINKICRDNMVKIGYSI